MTGGTSRGDGSVRYSVVVPVYNSHASVAELVRRTVEVFETEVQQPYEVVLVDDGSTDPRSWDTITELSTSHTSVIGVRLARNCGKSGAVMAGFSMARGEWIATIDDDLQQWPEDIVGLIGEETHDVVIGAIVDRADRRGKRFTSWLKGKADRVVLDIGPKMTPLKLLRRRVVEEMLTVQTSRPYIPALIAHATSDVVAVDVRHSPSAHGKSRYTRVRRAAKVLDLLIGPSSVLLRLLGVVGLLQVVAGFGVVGYALWDRVTASDPGTLPVVLAVLMLNAGAVMLALAVVGEFLSRILESTTDKRSFVIRRVVGTD